MRIPARSLLAIILGCVAASAAWPAAISERNAMNAYDVVVVGGTPGGIMAAIATARAGHSAVILERTAHIGGLPANGLGATDLQTRGATAGLFLEFVDQIRAHYENTYGADSHQVQDCSDGYHFEPHVAEQVFEAMLAEHRDRITVLRRRQFDALPENVLVQGNAVVRVTVTCRDTGERENYTGKVFIDATYEGDLAAAAGAPYRLGREGAAAFDEPMAGRLCKSCQHHTHHAIRLLLHH